VVANHLVHFFLGGADASQMAGRLELRLCRQPLQRAQSPVAGGAARAIGDGDEFGPDALQLGDRLPEGDFGVAGLGRKELEGNADATGFGRGLNHRETSNPAKGLAKAVAPGFSASHSETVSPVPPLIQGGGRTSWRLMAIPVRASQACN